MMQNRLHLKREVNHVCLIVASIVACFTVAPARAEFGDELFNLAASDSLPPDFFGVSVDISGTKAIIGRSTTATYAPDIPGAAYVYDLTTGQELGNFTASGALKSDQFSVSVAISGNIAIVGAPNVPANNKPGSAYLFDVTTATQLFKLTASDAAPDDWFGYSVAIDGNSALIGAHLNDTAGDESGAAYILDVATGQQRFKLTPSDAAEHDRFGFQVAISGNIAIVGAPASFAADNRPGSAYLFDVRTGQQLFNLTSSETKRDRFGSSVAISGNIAIVGAPDIALSGSSSGAAYLFDVSTGQELFKLTGSDAASADRFGQSVAISGNTAIVTALRNFAGGPGTAYLFDIATGQELMKLHGSASASEAFGFDAAIDGNIAVIGAPYFISPRHSNSGSAYVFDVTRTAGDFNNDGTVDAADYVVWRNGMGTTHTQADFNTWRANFGKTLASAKGATLAEGNSMAPAVPEPVSLVSMFYGLGALITTHRRGRPRNRVEVCSRSGRLSGTIYTHDHEVPGATPAWLR
jgi:WD40 repeat protein